jgi:hypothetical protein
VTAPTPCFEYIQLEIEFGDLDRLNALGSVGWHIVAWVPSGNSSGNANDAVMAILERQVPEGKVADVRKYYEKRKEA